ncbi:phosphate acetyltransferase [Mucilaginibacter paludis]|uniref:Phosphate acetyltransferase n=1 Tax=Mucilaginibacter paludis DSM 18603 TaxID=714943 RepID=H1Y9J2_9SPHI|nr:phosphate acetyltransferase [Mucilaginibacter paludis]EHQ29997.1 phosphate acetyltransferase [Mucilaginibacter paludis DSM 18603]
MAKTIFVASAGPCSGKSVITIGLVNMLLCKTQRVGYFKPVINTSPAEKNDVHIQTILEHFKLPIKFEDAYAFTRQEAMQYLESENQGQMIDTIISKFKRLEEQYDFTVLEGSDYIGDGTAFEFDLNLLIAKNLGCPAILVVSGEDKTSAQIINECLSFLHNFEEHDVQVLGLIANKVQADQVEIIQALLAGQLPADTILSVIPTDISLKNPTIKDIAEALGGKMLFGEDYMANQVDNFVTGAMMLPNFLNHIKDNVLIVTPGDRGDIILGSLQANLSSSYPKVAGIVLTAGTQPEEPIMRLIEGLNNVVPIMSVNSGTFHSTTQIGALKARITPDNSKKILLAIDTFNKFVNAPALDASILTYQSNSMTSHMFQYQLLTWAKRQIKTIVLPEGNDDRILKAAARLIDQQAANIVLLGKTSEVADAVKRLGLKLDLSKIKIIDPATSELFDSYAQTLFELRKAKGVTLETARDLMTDVSYFGTMMVYKGDADGMVSGAAHTTQHTIRPAMQFIKTKPGTAIVSSVFFMCLEDRVCVFGDCAVNPNPTAEELAEIAILSADTSKSFGIEPRVAMLSYSSGTSGVGEDVDKVRNATNIVKAKRPDLKVEGPIQYDAAVDPTVGKQKMPLSTVAGQASVLIFPDLNTGNNTYKAVQRETGALAIGPMLQGLNKPVNDLSRGCTVDDIFNTVIITAIQSQQANQPASTLAPLAS